MLLPIPSKFKPLRMTLKIKARKAVVLGIWVFHPGQKNTHYFRRKLTLEKGASREISIPLPITPKHLLLEIFDKASLSNKKFEVVDFSIKPMGEKKVWASPERHRFMEFAIQFAEKAGYVKPGFYPSKNDEFLIQYLPIIEDDFGNELITPARIHRQMPRVQLSQRVIRQMSIPVRVAILSHEGCHFFKNTRSEKEADLCGIQYYLDYGFPTIEAVYAATKVFGMNKNSIGPAHLQRTRDIMDFIHQYKKEAA